MINELHDLIHFGFILMRFFYSWLNIPIFKIFLNYSCFAIFARETYANDSALYLTKLICMVLKCK